jgi:hypothetical protein
MVGMGRLTLPLVTPLAAETTLQLVDYRARTLVRRRTGRAHQLGSARTRATVRVRSVVVLEIAEKIGKRGMHAGEGGKVELSRGGRRTRKSESAAKPSRCTRAHPNLFLETEQVQERHKWQSLTLANLGHGVTQVRNGWKKVRYHHDHLSVILLSLLLTLSIEYLLSSVCQ